MKLEKEATKQLYLKTLQPIPKRKARDIRRSRKNLLNKRSEIISIGQTLKHAHMTYSFLELLIFF